VTAGRTTVAVLGAGSWGTALALHGARLGHTVRLWGHDPARTRALASDRINAAYLPGFPLPESIVVEQEIGAAVERAAWVVLAVPSHAVRAVLEGACARWSARTPLLIATKGIETGSLKLMSEVASETLELAEDRIAVLSGPSFAVEVAKQHPTAVVVASSSPALAGLFQSEISSDSLRLYTNSDPRGVQLCGAVKNVLAIAAGILIGRDLGANSVAALMTRGLAEMQRLGVALGGRPATFAGLAGVGDLILTATGELSRNRSFGVEMGRGRSPESILAGTTRAVEGVRSAEAASRLAAASGVEMPIVDQVRRMIHEGLSIDAAIASLMARRLRSED
jgi:glycerol-3-phosphate dehydrogenase (NAD(P)+)